MSARAAAFRPLDVRGRSRGRARGWDNRQTARRNSGDEEGEALDAREIAEIHRRFGEGEDGAVRQVRDWVAAVVRGGRWGFADAEAVIQEALLALVHVVRDGRVKEPGGFQKFAYTVAKRTCVHHVQRERRRRERERSEDDRFEAADPSSPGAETLERADRVRALSYVLQQLSEDCRRLWEHVYCHRRPQEDVAREMEITVNNLRVRSHRCLQRARTIYVKYRDGAPSGGQRA